MCFGIWLGDELGLYRSLAATGPATADEVAARGGLQRPPGARMARRPGRGRPHRLTTANDRYSIDPRGGAGAGRRRLAGVRGPGDERLRFDVHGHRQDRAAFRGDGGLQLGRPPPLPVPGTEWFFRTGYRADVAELDPRARRCRSDKLDCRCARRRRRLRSRRIGRRDGRGVPEVADSRVRLPCPVDRHRPGARRGGRRRRPHHVRGRRRQELPGHVRPHLLLRLPPRHGRPGGHRPLRPRAPRARTAPCCSSSRSRSTAAPPTSPTTRWRRCSTRRRRRSARRTRCRRRSVSASAPRPARRGCARCSTRPATPHFRRATETPLNLILEAKR